jgi:hypothetical protein
VSVLWHVRYIVVSVGNWKQYVLRITTLTTICLRCHNIDNNMGYVSQSWQQYVLRIRHVRHIVVSVVTRKRNIVVSVVRHKTVLSVLWHVGHIAFSVVIGKKYCCRSCGMADILLSECNPDNNISYVSQHWQHCFTYHNTDDIYLTYHNANNNMSYVLQH